MSNYVVVFGALALSWLLTHLAMRWSGMLKEPDAAVTYFALIFLFTIAIVAFVVGLPFKMVN